jgi:hypothetical protein
MDDSKVLSDEARWEDIRKWAACFRSTPAAESWEFIFAEFDRLRALVSQARAEGAAEERERTRRERDALQAELFRVRGELSQRRLP